MPLKVKPQRQLEEYVTMECQCCWNYSTKTQQINTFFTCTLYLFLFIYLKEKMSQKERQEHVSFPDLQVASLVVL